VMVMVMVVVMVVVMVMVMAMVMVVTKRRLSKHGRSKEYGQLGRT
jgi:hypothetical protein